MRKEEILKALKTFAKRHGIEELKFRGVCFDMDGVLYDSMPAHSRSWQETAQEFGLTMSEEDCYLFEGQTGVHSINLLYQRAFGRDASSEEQKAVYQRKTELFVRYNAGKLIPQAPEVVEAFASLKRIVVTGSSQQSLLGRLDLAYPKVFSEDLLVTGRDVQQGKPKPEPYLQGMKKGKLQAFETIVIENAPKGVRSAHDAGCFTIAVNTGPLKDEILWEEGADLLFPNMASLLAYIPLIINSQI